MINTDSIYRPASHVRDRFFYGQAIAECVKAITRQYRFFRKGDLAASFWGRFLKVLDPLLGFALLFFCGCAITPIPFRRHETYQFQTDRGQLTIHVAGQTRVNEEMLKAGCTDKVYGFYDKEKQEIWTTAYIDTIMHELKHFFEGKFHE